MVIVLIAELNYPEFIAQNVERRKTKLNFLLSHKIKNL